MASDSHPTDDPSIEFEFYATGFDAGTHHLVAPEIAKEADPGGPVTTLCSFEQRGVVHVDSPEAASTLLTNFCGHCQNSAALPDGATDHLEALAARYDLPETDEDDEAAEVANEPPEDVQRITATDLEEMDRSDLRTIATHTGVNGNSSTEDLRASLAAIAPLVIEDE